MKQFSHHHFFCSRIAFQPISFLRSQLDAHLTRHLPSKKTEDELLQGFLQKPWFTESLYLASPSLFHAWQRANQKGILDEPLRLALWRYVLRSYCRSTPFGLFAGVGLGSIDEKTCFIPGESPWSTVSRIDSQVITRFTGSLINDRSLRQQVRYRLNSSLYVGSNDYRFVELSETESLPKPLLSTLVKTHELATITEALQTRGLLFFTELVELFPNEQPDLVASYLHSLIDLYYLISELTPPITGIPLPSYLHQIIDNHPTIQDRFINYTKAYYHLEKPLDLGVLEYAENKLRQQFDQLTIPLDSSKPLVQTDLFFYPEKLQLGQAVFDKLVDEFKQIAPLFIQQPVSPISDFVQRFRDQYDRQEIELMKALDPEIGIGLSVQSRYHSPLLASLPFPEIDTESAGPDHLQELRKLLFSRYQLTQQPSLELTPSDLEPYLTPVNFPPSWYLHGELFTVQNSTGEESIQSWRFALNAMTLFSPVFMMSRFCHGNQDLYQHVKQLCDWEQNQYPDDLLVELVHLPVEPARAGNVTSRPILRSIELPYLSPPGVDESNTISLSQLLVSIDNQGKIRLRDKVSGRRVRIRHSTAHNPGLGDEIYQFLYFVQQSEYPSLHWSWKGLSELPALPRLTYKNLIICPAQWTIIANLLPVGYTFDIIQELYKLPRFVLVVEQDNKLLLDLHLIGCQQILLEETRKTKQVYLKEWLAENWQPWLTHEGESYCSEILIPIKSIGSVTSQDTTFSKDNTLLKRRFLPLDTWLYLKVYVNEGVSDWFLINIILPFVQKAQTDQLCSLFFFVRYVDTEYHLRLRFKLTNSQGNALMTAFNQLLYSLVDNGQVKGVQVDSYDRELERYKPELMESVEHIFHIDSQTILAFFQATDPVSEIDRYQFALNGIDQLLSDFGFSIQEKLNCCRQLQRSFFEEHGSNKALKRATNSLYRHQSSTLFQRPNYLLPLLTNRSAQFAEPIAVIKSYYRENNSQLDMFDLVQSLIHMMVNRLFPGLNRHHELIVYHFLSRSYESMQANRKVD